MAEPEPSEGETGARKGRWSTGKIAGLTTGVIALAVFVFWFGWVRAPSPEEVCAHKMELVLATAAPDQREGADALIARLELNCVQAARRKIKLRGKLIWAEYAKCVVAAETLMEAERC
jgi:hypothetical protein